MEAQKIDAIGRALLEVVNFQPLATVFAGRCRGMVYMAWARYPGRGVYGHLRVTLPFPCGKATGPCRSFLGCN